MADKKNTNPVPVSVVFSPKLQNCKFVLSSTPNNRSNEIITNFTTLPASSFQITPINKNLSTTNKVQQTSLINQSVVRAIAPVRLPTNATKSITLQPQQKNVITQQSNIIFSQSSPSKIIIQTVPGGAFQKLQRQTTTIPRPLISNTTNKVSTILTNNSLTKNNPQIFRLIGPSSQIQLDTSNALSSKLLPSTSQVNRSKSLSIVNPAQLTKSLNNNFIVPQSTTTIPTSQRLILPATSQFHVTVASNHSLLQNISLTTTISTFNNSSIINICSSSSSISNSCGNITKNITININNNNGNNIISGSGACNNNQGFTFLHAPPTVITPTNQSVLSDSSEGNSSDNNSMSYTAVSTSNETLRNNRQQLQQQHWPILESSLRQRKPCNCTKSQCLKLYCECFANGEFCKDCNCCNCANNLQHEEERTRAVKSCIERNPHAFHPKIG